MRSPRSWTSSIVGFALAVLLVGWALDEFAGVLRRDWPILAAVALVIAAALIGVRLWRNRSGW